LAADLIVGGDLPTYWPASFHAQQAAEKALKGLLTRHQIEFAKTHNIGELLQLTERAVTGFSGHLDSARELTRHAVTDRYPGEEIPINREAAGRHVDLARGVVDIVKAELRSYLDAGRPSS
jgi:HEPN domain-containing protein